MKRHYSLIFCAAALALAGSTALQADSAGMTKSGDLMIYDAWARASLGRMPNSAAYLKIETTGDEPDKLISAFSEGIDAVETHTHVMDNGVAKMRPVDVIDVMPGETTVFEPGGLHLMLIGVKETLIEGDAVTVTLVFEKAGEVSLDIPIQGLKAMKQGTHEKHDMNHGEMNTTTGDGNN